MAESMATAFIRLSQRNWRGFPVMHLSSSGRNSPHAPSSRLRYRGYSKKRLRLTDTVIPIARSMIEAGSGTQFDPDIVAIFLKIQDAFVEVKERFAECPQIIT